jgi:alpha-glucosidase
LDAAIICLVLLAAAPLGAETVSDRDNDGVADAQDCAPDDARLANEHTYFWDADGDQSGNSGNPLTVCQVTLFNGSMPLGGDPNDSDNSQIAGFKPHGSRVLGLDFALPAESGQWRADAARELGADAATFQLQWGLIETAAGSFTGPQAALAQYLRQTYGAEGFSVHLTLSPFAGTAWSVPPDLEPQLASGQLKLSDPAVVARFTAMLDFLHGALGDLPLAGLQIGHEVDRLLPLHPDTPFWSDYANFFVAVRAHAQALWGPSLRVGITGTAKGLLTEPAASLLKALNAAGDVVGVTYFPYDANGRVTDPSQVKDDVAQIVARYFPKPIAFTAVGYPSAPAAGSSETRQAQFVGAFFQAWDAYADVIPFAAFASLHDPDAADAYTRSVGLRTRTGQGAAKAAYQTFRTQTLNRGWWHAKMPSTRPFLLGFTLAPYDHNPGGSMIDTALADTSRQVGAHADMSAIHFDYGVPWSDAYTDTFSSADAPYSANLREVWAKERAARAPGTTLAVAANPIGIPREHLAPYWGIGEGFYHDANFNAVSTGVIQDYQERLLTAPWNTYQLDSPQVKTAYLNYLRRVIEYFHPKYLITGIEVNLILQTNPAAFQQYVELQRYVYTQLRANHAYDDVRILVSFVGEYFVDDEYGVPQLTDTIQRPELKQIHIEGLRQLAPYTDVIGLSVYPIKTRFGTYEITGGFYDALMSTLRSVTDKPVGITETGYPTSTFHVNNLFFAGTQEKQRESLQLMFYEAGKYGFEFVTNFSVRDQTQYMDKLRARAQETPPFISPELVNFFKYFEFIGIFNSDGTAKTAADLFASTLAIPLANPDQRVVRRTFASPDGHVTATVGVGADGRLSYNLARDGVTVLEDSPLGITVDGSDLGQGIVEISLRQSEVIDETYRKWGAHASARNHANEYILDIHRVGTGDRLFSMVWRLYDEGLAFRYIVPGSGTRWISGEATGWTLPADSPVWHQLSTNNYESPYLRQTIGTFNTDIGGPLTVELSTGAGYLVLTEGALRNASGMTFDADLGSNRLHAQFLDDSGWQVAGGSETPWRLAIVSPTLNGLVNADMVTNVNQAPDPALFPDGLNTGWIRPGKAVWSWWSDNNSGALWDTQKAYVDYATRLRAEYVTIDIWWEEGFPTAEKDKYQRLADLAAYGHTKEKDVGLWVWRHWSKLADPDERRTFFQKVREAGAVGVKIDYMSELRTESAENVDLFEEMLRDAAEFKLMLNFHGLHKPTGLERTWPNLVGHEGLAGLEYTSLLWSTGQYLPITHNAAIPFVRLVAGPADFTPVTFDPRKLGDTTFAFQLATAGLFNSTIEHFADDPKLFLAQPVQDILRTLPTTWDETIVLPQSRIGSLVAEARRKGDRWYLFVINADAANAVSLTDLPLSFLDARQYNGTLIGDATKTSFDRRSKSGLTNSDTIDVIMLPGGGFTALFQPAPAPERRVLQGFSSIPPNTTTDGWGAGYIRLRDHGDLVSHSLQEGIPWPEALLSSDPRNYSQHINSWWSLLKSADEAVIPDKPRYLMINPIETVSYGKLAPYLGERDYMPLPAPWDTYEFNDPAVKTALVNYIVAAIEHFHPQYVATSIEANILLAKRPDRWTAFKELNQHVYTEIKQRYPNIKVFTTIHYEHLLGLAEESRALALQLRDSYPNVLEAEVRDLLRYSDYVAISSYPFMMENNRYIGPDNKMDFDYFDRAFAIARDLGKPVVFEQTGYITQDLMVSDRGVIVPGSDQRQQDYLDLVLGVAHTENNVDFVVNFTSGDYGTNYGSFPSTLTWAYIGLYREDGSPKPALALWDAYRAEVNTQPSAGFDALKAGIRSDLTAGGLTPPWSDGESPAPELFLRWQQAASLLPLFTPPGGNPTAPFSFAESYTAAARATLALRERLMPYLLPLFEDFQKTGISPLHLLSTEGSPAFTIGDWLLVAPMTDEGATTRQVTFPDGSEWLDWNTHQVYAGGETAVIEAPLARLPLFVRAAVAPPIGGRQLKGSRILGIEVKPTEINIWDPVQVAQDFLGVQSVQLMLDWNQIEQSPGVYSGEILDAINAYYGPRHIAVSLTIRPVDAIHKNVPTDLLDQPFDSPMMIYRFKSLLNFVYSKLTNVTIASLGIGNEVDEWLRVSPDTFEAYKAFYNAELYFSKLMRPDVRVGVSANLHALVSGSRAVLLEQLNQWSDVLLVLYYPMDLQAMARPLEEVGADIDQFVARYPIKPIHFREAGYPANVVVGGSNENQAAFIREMFAAWDSHADRIELVSFFHLTDFSPEQVDFWLNYYQGEEQTPEFRGFLEGLGLRTWFGNGVFKPAFFQFLVEAHARGW